jgi:curli biogenesis system outer membrane secretion channel CsgG
MKNTFSGSRWSLAPIAVATLASGLLIGALPAQASPKSAAKPTAVQAKSAKPTISVPSFKNDTDSWWWRSETARELGDALSNELTSTGNFKVVERQKLDAVLSEQELAELGLVRQETGAKKGQLTGAQYVVLGRVTAFEEGVEQKSTGIGISGISIGGIGLGGSGRKQSQQAYVAIDLRVVDTTTGEVMHSRTVEGRATSESKGGNVGVSIFGVGVGGNQEETKRAPVGKALRAALIESTEYLSCVMVKQDGCVAKYEAKDEKRREKTKGVLELE